jgi:DNA polymerase III subunit delta'
MIYPWQREHWSRLLKSIHEKRLPYALLLESVPGMGKAAFADHLAAFLLCEDRTTDGACGHCKGCALYQAGSHPDFFDVKLEEKSKVIKVDQVRSLCEKLFSTAHRSGFQVAIINPADTLNRAGANALLKTLEEPAGSVLIILIASSRHALPQTIQSRAKRVTFVPAAIAPDDLLQRLAEGAPLRAKILEEKNVLALRKSVLQHLGLIYQNNNNPIAPIADWLKQDVVVLLDLFLSIVKDVVALHCALPMRYMVHQDESAKLLFLQKHISLAHLLLFEKKLLTTRMQYLHAQGINPQLLLESLLLDWRP